MLVNAEAFQDALEKLIESQKKSNRMKDLFLDGGTVYFRNDPRAIQFVSVVNEEITGYFQACFNPSTKSILNLVWVNFLENYRYSFVMDFCEFIYKELFHTLDARMIAWTAVVGGKNEKMYDKFIKKINGRIVCTKRSEVLLNDGKRYDLKYYEVSRADFETSSFFFSCERLINRRYHADCN